MSSRWKAKATGEPVQVGEEKQQIKQLKDAAQSPPLPRGWFVTDYPATAAQTRLKNQETEEELDLMEAIAELLNRTEE